MILKINTRIIILLMLTLIISICYLSVTIDVSKNEEIVQTRSRAIKSYQKTNQTSTTTKTVLFWTNYFSQKRWYLPEDTATLQCPLADCIFTIDRTFLPSLDMYDAVLFHTARNFNSVPNVRGAQQLYVMAQLESPQQTMHDLKNDRDFYNLTMTYRFDADVYWAYNMILDKKTNGIIAPSLFPRWQSINTEWTQTDQKLLDMTKKKKKLVAWFVSRCKAVSKREQLVKKLQNYIHVDMYGGCGKLKCARHNSECDDLLDKTYKFYLSFENSLCIDYVTEKLFDALQRNVVPIVYGGANYSYFAPPHSYIDAQSFPNVSALADYIQYLDNTPLEYVKYFWWKRYYEIPVHFEPAVPYCDLCHRINSKSVQERTQIYRDVNSYWHSGTCTRKSKIVF